MFLSARLPWAQSILSLPRPYRNSSWNWLHRKAFPSILVFWTKCPGGRQMEWDVHLLLIELSIVFTATHQLPVPYSEILKQQNRCSQTSSLRDLLVPASSSTLLSSFPLSNEMRKWNQIHTLHTVSVQDGEGLRTFTASGRFAKNLWAFIYNIYIIYIIIYMRLKSTTFLKMELNSMIKDFFKRMDFWLECNF